MNIKLLSAISEGDKGIKFLINAASLSFSSYLFSKDLSFTGVNFKEFSSFNLSNIDVSFKSEGVILLPSKDDIANDESEDPKPDSIVSSSWSCSSEYAFCGKFGNNNT